MESKLTKKTQKGKKNTVKFTVEGVQKVAGKVNLTDISMLSSEAIRSDENTDFESMKVEELFKFSLETGKGNSKSFKVLFHFGIRGVRAEDSKKSEKSEDKNIGFQIEAFYQLDYSLISKKGITKDDVRSFAALNSPIHAWPYWREFVHSQTFRMGLPTILVGLRPPRPDLEAEHIVE